MMTAARLIGAIGILSAAGVAVSACSGGDTGAEPLGTSSSAITRISGCDYSDARPSPASLRSMGYHFVARYLSGDPGGSKDLSASEARSLTAAGLDIVVVWETTGTDARDGYSRGVSDAKGAKSEAESVGQPSSRPIYFAVDFDAESGDAASIKEYFKGVASVLGLSRTGVYGGYYIVDELLSARLVTFAWQTYAWSYGRWDSRAQLRQTQNGVDHDELDADEAVAADFGQWRTGGSEPSTCKLAGHTFAQNTCTETRQCDGGRWVERSSDPSSCKRGVEPDGKCLTDSGLVEAENTCTLTLHCNDGVWVDWSADSSACRGSSSSGTSCKLAGHAFEQNTCTETRQCDDGRWVERSSDPSSCKRGIEPDGKCLTDSGSVEEENTCTLTLQCNDGVWVDRVDDPSSCR